MRLMKLLAKLVVQLVTEFLLRSCNSCCICSWARLSPLYLCWQTTILLSTRLWWLSSLVELDWLTLWSILLFLFSFIVERMPCRITTSLKQFWLVWLIHYSDCNEVLPFLLCCMNVFTLFSQKREHGLHYWYA